MNHLRGGLAACLVALCPVLAAGGGAAAEFWESEPFMKWSDGQVQRILTRSPWAARLAVALPPRVDGTAGPARHELTLIWRSALPIRQAIVRTQAGSGRTLTAQQQAILAEPSAYLIVVDHVPFPFQSSQIEAFLRRKNKLPIPAQQITSGKTPTGFDLLIAFPRTDLIAPEDREWSSRSKRIDSVSGSLSRARSSSDGPSG